MKNTAAEKRKQVPKGYLVVGVDPHKKKHAAVAMTRVSPKSSENAPQLAAGRFIKGGGLRG